MKQYLIKGISINEKRCLAHSDHLYEINQQLASYSLRITFIKDAGKKRFVMTKIETIKVGDLLKNLEKN